MWKDFIGKDFSRDEFAAYVAGLKWTDWKPQGICLHNTAAPTLAQWAESGPNHQARIANLQSYYEGLGWHAGPAAFISRTKITVFSGFTEPGVHSRCFNATHIGIEMVGDYNAEPFDTGDGALVRDNAVFALATLYRALGLSPADLKFHVDCKIDNHDCPGKNVNKSAMIGRVSEAMSKLFGVPDQVKPPEVVPPVALEPWSEINWPISPMGTYRIAWIQDAFNRLSPPEFAIHVDGVTGPETINAIRRFQHEQNLHLDGVAGPITVSVIKDMLQLKGT